jgi:hypothetical protein
MRSIVLAVLCALCIVSRPASAQDVFATNNTLVWGAVSTMPSSEPPASAASASSAQTAEKKISSPEPPARAASASSARTTEKVSDGERYFILFILAVTAVGFGGPLLGDIRRVQKSRNR